MNLFLSHFPDTVINYFPDHGEGHGILSKSDSIPHNYGSFFTVNGFKSGVRKKSELTSINGIYTDIDSKDRTREELLMEMSEYAIPTFINETKSGYHVIWLFAHPVGPENIEDAEGMNKTVRMIFGGDAAATDAARLLRIPGTEHRKDPDNTYLIRTVHESGERYTFDELKEVFPPYVEQVHEHTSGASELSQDSVAERVALMLQDDRINALYSGDTSAYDGNGSRADQAFCCHLAFWLGKDREAMRNVWVGSPLGSRKKTQTRRDYQDVTLDNAIRLTSETYTPRMPKPLKTALSETTVHVSIPTRDHYIQMRENPDWGDKEWIKRFQAAQEAYILDFHNYFAVVNPHLIFERNEDKVYWNYNEDTGIYEEISGTVARGMVIALIIEEGLPHKATEAYARDCLARYRAVYARRGIAYDDFDTHTHFFHARNGWIDVRTGQFEPHTPERRSRRVSNVVYDPEALCPLYDTFLDTDIQVPQDRVRVIDQFSGLCLTGDMRFQKMLTLIGRPGSGKSTLLEAWVHILGDCAVQKRLGDLTGDSFRFAGSSLVGKSLCWFDEVDVKKSEMGNTLGTLITGEKINVERKGINTILSARNSVKCVLTANTLPLSSEHGMYRRMIYIKFERSFYDEGVANKDLLSQLKDEAPGILNRMIRGLKDLYDNNGFTFIEGHDDDIEDYKAQSHPIAEFLDEFFEPGGEDDRIKSGSLYEAFYSSEVGKSFYKLSPQKFGQMMSTQPLTRFKITTHKGAQGVRMWKGIKIKEGFYLDEFNNIGQVVSGRSF